jgi:hypothetical protein
MQYAGWPMTLPPAHHAAMLHVPAIEPLSGDSSDTLLLVDGSTCRSS